jgi:hypothetical protein
MNALYDKNGNSFTGIVAEAQDNAEDMVIREKMLDGSYAVQKVGDPSITVSVVFCCSQETRRAIATAQADADLVTLSWRGATYAGHLSGLKYEALWPKVLNRQNKIKFDLLVEVEA